MDVTMEGIEGHRPPPEPKCSCGEDWPCPAVQEHCPGNHGSQCCGYISECEQALIDWRAGGR